MPTIDAFSGAENSVDAQKRALLAAVAQQGTAGKASYEAQMGATIEARRAAVEGAGQRAHAVADTYAKDNKVAAGTMAAEAARAQQANATYMDQVKTAVPLSRQLAESQQADMLHEAQQAANARRQATADADRERNWAVEDRSLSRRMLMEDRAHELATRAASAESNPLAALVERLGGNDLARTQLTAVAQQALAAAQPKPTNSTTRILGSSITVPRITRLTQSQQNEVLEGVAEELGLPPGVLQTFLGKANPAAPATGAAADAQAARKNPAYAGYVEKALDAVEQLRADTDLSLGEARARVAAKIRMDPAMKGNYALTEAVIQDALGG